MSHVYTLGVVGIGWVFFRADNMKAAVTYCKSLLGLLELNQPGFEVQWYLNNYVIFILAIAVLLCTPIPRSGWLKLKSKYSANIMAAVENAGLSALFLLSLMRVVASSYNPFIYFQF